MNQITSALIFTLMIVAICARPGNVKDLDTTAKKPEQDQPYSHIQRVAPKQKADHRPRQDTPAAKEPCKIQLQREPASLTPQISPKSARLHNENLKSLGVNLQPQEAHGVQLKAGEVIATPADVIAIPHESSKDQGEVLKPCIHEGVNGNGTGKDGMGNDDDRIGTTVLISLGGPGK